jgi:hypothetical protein
MTIHAAWVSFVVFKVSGHSVPARPMRSDATVAMWAPLEPILIQSKCVLKADSNPFAPDTDLAEIWKHNIGHVSNMAAN